MVIHNREFDDERCKNCSVNAKCLGCDVYLKFDNPTAIKEQVDNHIAELKGEEYKPDDWDSLANAERDH